MHPRAPPTEWYKGYTLNPSVFCRHILSTSVPLPSPLRVGAAVDMCHLHNLHWAVPLFGRLQGQGSPPNPSRFGTPPRRTRIRPPQPVTIWSGRTRNASRFGAAPKQIRMGPPRTLHDLERLPEGTSMGPSQPFTIWWLFPFQEADS